MKKLLSILLSGAMALSLAACSSGGSATTAADKAAETAASHLWRDGETYGYRDSYGNGIRCREHRIGYDSVHLRHFPFQQMQIL